VVQSVLVILNEAYIKVRFGKHMPNLVSIHNYLKQGGTLLPLFFNFL
jgi:hypothetical protein